MLQGTQKFFAFGLPLDLTQILTPTYQTANSSQWKATTLLWLLLHFLNHSSFRHNLKFKGCACAIMARTILRSVNFLSDCLESFSCQVGGAWNSKIIWWSPVTCNVHTTDRPYLQQYKTIQNKKSSLLRSLNHHHHLSLQCDNSATSIAYYTIY